MPRFIASCTSAAALTLAATVAFAQTPAPEPPAERPSRALFGSWEGETTQALTASGALSTGFDSNVVADALGTTSLRPSDVNTSNRGQLVNGSAALAYSITRDRVSLGATAGTSARYYPSSFGGTIFRRDQASANGSLQLPLNISVSASAAYRPFNMASLYPMLLTARETDIAGDDFGASSEHYLSWSGGLGSHRQLSRRLRVSGDVSYGSRARSTELGDFRRVGGGGGLTYSLTRDLNLKAGYHYSEARYGAQDRRLAQHLIDAGVDFTRNLSISRRTTVTFGTGTTAMTNPGSESGQTRFRLNGNVALRHEIGRTWSAALTYGRGLQLSEHWPEPVQSDSVAVSFGGSISRRLQFSSGASTSTGRMGLDDRSGGHFDAYQGSATLSYGISRYVGAGLTYTTYHHKFDQARLLAPGFGPWVDRHRVAVQISVSAPLYQRARRADATR